tara:strand:+ start:33 stop:212 length:180 start_codon:yes stop_codon:yes gene_type:complete
MSKEELYQKALLKWGFNWLPGTPPGTYLQSFEVFTRKIESDSEFYNKIVENLNQNKDER